jgi:hypothetical protein
MLIDELERETDMKEREFMVVTPSESSPLQEDQIEVLEKKIEEKTGKKAIVLPPGCRMRSVIVHTNK